MLYDATTVGEATTSSVDPAVIAAARQNLELIHPEITDACYAKLSGIIDKIENGGALTAEEQAMVTKDARLIPGCAKSAATEPTCGYYKVEGIGWWFGTLGAMLAAYIYANY